MTKRLTPLDVLDREFLGVRHALIDIAAALDRIDRADGPEAPDKRMDQMKKAALILTDAKPDRAPRVQMVFSDGYDESWRTSTP